MQTAPSSPSKRTSFRSKQKHRESGGLQRKNSKEVVPYKNYLKDFPIETPQQVMALLRNFEVTHNTFLENLENLKLYKQQLGNSFEDNWGQFMQFLKTVVSRILKADQKLFEEKERKIKELLLFNLQLESERQKWKDEIEKIKALRDMEGVEAAMVSAELAQVNRQMSDIYQILQADMGNIMHYLAALETKKSQDKVDTQSTIFSALHNLSAVLSSIDSEQREAGKTLSTMREVIKAMNKCSKISTGTQVEEGELEAKVGKIFENQQCSLPFEQSQICSVNVAGQTRSNHLIDQLKEKARDIPLESVQLDKHGEKPWALTPALLVFLENMSKENEAAKVLPWQHMSSVIHKIYTQRIDLDQQMLSVSVGNGMQFDQFVVYYFISKYRIRRLAELKLLGFIISLKYYCKFWQKAETFCIVMGVMRFLPLGEAGDAFTYCFDHSTQTFFFAVYRLLMSLQTVTEEGATYVPCSEVKRIMKAILFFSEEMNISRLSAKVDKGSKIFNTIEHCDFDHIMLLFIEQYFSVRKGNNALLAKSFAKKHEQIQGYFSLDETQQLFNDLQSQSQKGAGLSLKYPCNSKVHLARLYLYTMTSGKNNYEMNCNNFVTSCQRYGFDSPFPFLSINLKNKKGKEVEQITAHLEPKVETKAQIIHNPPQFVAQITKNKQVTVSPQKNLNTQRIDVAAKLFSQHFSLLRQLHSYVQIFRASQKDEKDPAILWKSFEQITEVLRRGCQFMKYPLVAKML